MALTYPHKQTIIIASVCIIAIAGVAFYTQREKINTDGVLGVSSSIQAPAQESEVMASTSTNWQKDFFTESTSTKNAKLAKTTPTDSPDTLTSEMGKDFFTRYMVLRQANQADDQDAVKTAMDQTIANAAISAPQPKTYVLSNIKISSDNSSAAVHAYVNAVATFLLTDISRIDPTTVATDALNNDDLGSLKDIDPVIAGYQKVIADLMALSAPSDLSATHLNLINSLSVLLYVSQGLRHIQEDSMQSMVALGVYSTGQDSLKASLLNIKDYITSHNIPINSNETGYLYFKINP